jgi:hypothetical protein
MMQHQAEGPPYACRCCGIRVITEIGVYEICGTCGWEDDPVQSASPDTGGGANAQSLRQAQTAWTLLRGGERSPT